MKHASITSLAEYRLIRSRPVVSCDPVQDEIALCRRLASEIESLPPLLTPGGMFQRRDSEGATFDRLIEEIQDLLPPEPIPAVPLPASAPCANVSQLFSEDEQRWHDAQAAFQRIRNRVHRRTQNPNTRV